MSEERASSVEDLLWDMQRLSEIRPTKKNADLIQIIRRLRHEHALLVRGAVYEHAFNALVAAIPQPKN